MLAGATTAWGGVELTRRVSTGREAQAELRADLAAACNAAKAIGITLESIVFPRNQFNADYLEACRAAGLIGSTDRASGRYFRAIAIM